MATPATPPLVHCRLHKTATPGYCVMCAALAATRREHPLPDGALGLRLNDEDAVREAEIRPLAKLRKRKE